MSEVEHVTDGGGAVTPVGQLLREARERAHLSAADVARQLRLGLRQVEALEANDFASLPGNTIVRGFIRNYAKLLQVDPAGFLAAYEAATPAAGSAPAAPVRENIDISPRPSRRWLWYLAAGALLVVGVPLVIYALLHDDGRAPAVAPRPAATAPAPQAAPPLALPVPLAAAPAPESAAAPAPGATAAAAAPAVPAPPEGTPAPPEAGIQMAFDEDAWVEIRDGSGQRIFSQLNRKGGTETVTGQAPFSLVIGNAAKVRLTYNGKPVDLQPYIRVNVARLTLE
jgi:cytoskeleton protein RodZ